MSAQPIAVKVTRYKCPHCSRTASRAGRTQEHMARCWFNPEARGCKTCKHFEPADGDSPDPTIGYPGSYEPESCGVGVDLTGHRACPACGGYGWADISSGAQVPCGPKFTDQHVGDGAEVKPGPIVHCSEWESAE